MGAEGCFATLEAALAATEAEAVLVTTALDAHLSVVQAALAAGKHVLLEKPFAPSLEGAQQAVAAAAARGRVLMVSQNYRFYPAVQQAARLVREGVLGAVSGVSVDFRKYANVQPRGAHRHYTIRQPLLMDMAIHHFDLMRFVLGQEPVAVHCQAWNPPWSRFEEPATATATIPFDGGAVVSYRGSWVSTGQPTPWAGAWQIECAEGTIHWSSRGDKGPEADRLTLRPRGKRAQAVPLPALAYSDRAGSLAAFVAAIRTGAEPPASGRDNLQSLALMLAAIESATSGQPQKIAATGSGG